MLKTINLNIPPLTQPELDAMVLNGDELCLDFDGDVDILDNAHIETRCIGKVDEVTGKVTNLKLVSCDIVSD
jgi:hypothetical protein